MVPHFDGTVTLGNVFTVFAFLAAALFAWRDLNWRVNNLEAWKSAHEHTTEEQVRNIALLRENAAVLTKLAEGQEYRIRMLEEFRMQNGKTLQ